MKILMLALILGSGLLLGCASQTKLTASQITIQYPLVGEAEEAIRRAESQRLQRYAPEHIEQARSSYQKATKQATNDNPEATNSAQQVVDYVVAAEQQAAEAQYVFDEVIAARERAIEANADSLVGKRFSNADERLLMMFAQLEQGDDERAKRNISELKNEFLAIELAALKTNMLSTAERWLDKAKREDLDDRTPILFRQAYDEYQLALNTLEADRTNTQRANIHSNQAIALAKRAQYVAALEEYFDNADFSEEQKIVWFQNQFATALAPLMGELAFDKPYKDTVQAASARIQEEMATVAQLNTQITTLSNQLRAAGEQASAKQAELQKQREAELLVAQMELEQEQQAKRKNNALFEGVQSLFDDSEATVYRQRDNVLIRAHGFAFPSGSSEIESSNFALLNKIIEAVSRFPNSKVSVSGHTDATGSDELNMKLSQNRAETVAGFLNKVGKISQERLSYEGFGEEKPVASNETPDGRAQNRRVEILIIN
ncbi:OmpA family protein [Alteromonas sp. ASW11-130]|uniref:OmpA family protein n=1 Tax=Alteromonas sp. ASW11-130 TaxID=3015775 RepID=UPI00224293A4|nr:OmpA family protein [Alteromonas sp. ASW11-130]MCW8090760.1 OmpA family protein [Alteromonas sp. ASW11-130]